MKVNKTLLITILLIITSVIFHMVFFYKDSFKKKEDTRLDKYLLKDREDSLKIVKLLEIVDSVENVNSILVIKRDGTNVEIDSIISYIQNKKVKLNDSLIDEAIKWAESQP